MIIRKKWKLKEYDEGAAEIIRETTSVLPVTSVLLAERGCYDKQSAISFINKENTTMPDPFLLPDMKEAVLRIIKAERDREKVMVYGDYDVDGITGTSVLVLFFRRLGLDVSYYIPKRLTEGYGVNSDAVRAIAEKGVRLLVTVDTGITAVEEVKLANKLGMDVIVTDHHECRPDLPPAVAVVDPKRPDSQYPFDGLAGVGVAFKLICAYYIFNATGTFEYDPADQAIIFDAVRDCYKLYSDITALGTIADVMPVMKENRLIIAYGLNKMKKTKNKGLMALLKATELITEDNECKKLTSTSVAFIIAPRINAAGRLGDADSAVELFLTESDNEAEELALKLCEQNKERQRIELEITEDAEKKIAEGKENDKKMIVLSGDTWHHGVVGIVSSRITDKYNLPSILVSFDEGGSGKGSGRSIEGFDLLAAITFCSDRLTKFGGHKSAAGLSLDKADFEKFKADITEYAESKITSDMLQPVVYADTELEYTDINTNLTEDLSKLEPFGEGNPVPVFLMRDLKITDIIPLKNGKHTRVCFSKDGHALEGLFFGMQTENFGYIISDTVDILFNLSENEYRGTVSAQMLIRDVRMSETAYAEYEADNNVYEYIKDDVILPQKEHIPSRDDCAAVFKRIKLKCEKSGEALINVNKLLKTELKGIGYVKLRLILDIFEELGFITVSNDDMLMFDIKLLPAKEKTQLSQSGLFVKLQG